MDGVFCLLNDKIRQNKKNSIEQKPKDETSEIKKLKNRKREERP